jgi:hypothetical protein
MATSHVKSIPPSLSSVAPSRAPPTPLLLLLLLLRSVNANVLSASVVGYIKSGVAAESSVIGSGLIA